MAIKHGKEKREPGGYAPLSYIVSRSNAFALLSAFAVKLLCEFMSQYNGKNNGDMSMEWSKMEKRGWSSKATLYKARQELLEKGWIEVTRQGKRPRKATLYALTFYSIDECNGKLDVSPTKKPSSLWKF